MVYGSEEGSEQDLAKAAQNPVADLISLPFQNNTNFGLGDYDRTQNVLNIQPVIPFGAGPFNIMTRTIAPVMYQPDLGGSDGGISGLGDTSFTAWVSPAKPGKLVWGIGPALSLPTATDPQLGTKKWGIGPSVIGLITPGKWVVGAFFNNIWSFAGDSDRPDVSRFLLQYFINYNLSNGWYLVTAPIITSDWKVESGERWVVPFGGGLGKIFRIGGQPVNANAQVFVNAEKPENGPDWGVRFQFQFLFPKGR